MNKPIWENKNFSSKFTLFRQAAFFLYSKIIKPKSLNEDLRRREFILNIILISIIVLLAILDVMLIYQKVSAGTAYNGVPVWIFNCILLFFLAIYALSRTKHFVISSYILLAWMFLSITYSAYNWGVDLPSALLGYALLIIVSSILINTQFGLITTFVVTLTMFAIGHNQLSNSSIGTNEWKNNPMSRGDIIEYAVFLVIIMTMSWLSNREIEKSLVRAHNSESQLKEERDMLEIKVEQRTRELRQTQVEKMMQLDRFAEFGRLASGFFHDLVNPLTAVSLSMEKLKENNPEQLKDTQHYLNQAFDASKRMEDFILAARKQLQTSETKELFSLNEEINQVLLVLEYKAKKANVETLLDAKNVVALYGNPLKFYQVMLNIISNAIDAYDTITHSQPRRVNIKITAQTDQAIITTEDFGSGIDPKNIGKIFEPFFTTKSAEKGTGIGLTRAKDIIEKDFGGQIKVSSQNSHTIFTITLPLTKPLEQ